MSLWHDPATWIALGVSALFLGLGVVMHRAFVTILKNGSRSPQDHE